MMDRVVNPDVVADWEDVARMLFRPFSLARAFCHNELLCLKMLLARPIYRY